MPLPRLHGVIDRRILLNFHVDPQAVARWLPAPFQPVLVKSWAIAGICLIRLRQLRPVGMPSSWGLTSQNAAVRIAVQWQTPRGLEEGVYIPRRVSPSRVNRWLGGRLFPGVHTPAEIQWSMAGGQHQVDVSEPSGQLLSLRGRPATSLPEDSVFSSTAECSRFFARGACGYSPYRSGTAVEGLRLCCENWSARPFAVEHCAAPIFEDSDLFPRGTAHYDSALLMEDIPHHWQALPPLPIEVHRQFSEFLKIPETQSEGTRRSMPVVPASQTLLGARRCYNPPTAWTAQDDDLICAIAQQTLDDA